MTKFVDENNNLEMESLKAIAKIAVFLFAFSSIIDIVSMIKH